MNPSADNPIYTVYLVSGGTKYNVSPALVGIEMSDQKKQIAQSAKVELMNIRVGNSWLSNLINVRDRVFIYANDGTMNDEVFRGYVWTRGYTSALTDRTIELKCYDNLIYFQESDDSEYFPTAKSTEDILGTFCFKWGIPLKYEYPSILHSKLALRGKLSDIFTSDVLDLVKDRKGKDYVILSIKDTMHVREIGTNSTVHTIEAGKNAVKTSRVCTMDGMITKVIILGKADEDDRQPLESEVWDTSKTNKYGTLQAILDRDENTTLKDAQEEAHNIIRENGSPKWEYEVKCRDIPWIRKGDKVHVNAGDINNKDLIAVSVDRDISNDQKVMTLTLEEIK